MDKYVDNFNPHLELTELNQKVKKLEKENAKLKKELEDLEFRFECFKKSPPYKAVELAQKGMDELKEENAQLREALEKITDLHADYGHDMLNIAYKALKQGKEEE